MFRSSLRSFPDPLREHVCFNCRLARGLPRRAPTRAFRATPQSHSSHDGAAAAKEAPPASSTNEASGDSSETLDSDRVSNIKKSLNNQESTQPASHQQTGEKTDSAASPQSSTSSPDPAGLHSEDAGVQKTVAAMVKDLDKKPKKPSARKPAAKKPTEKPTEKSTEKNPVSSTRQPFEQVPSILHPSIKYQYRGTTRSNQSKLKPIKVGTPPVPKLSFGLDRALFNPGVYHLRDPRSRVYNFDPYLGSIMPVTEFDFAALKDYITSSKDETLRNVTKDHRKKYMGSSSSMTGVLSQFHYLFSAWRPVNTNSLSQGHPTELKSFTRLLRAPAAMFLRWQDGTYAIDADKEFDSANILMNLGKSMEKLLTLPKEEFERYRRTHANKITQEEEAQTPESYHYSTLGDFMMRSQLDAYDPRLPGTGMFDLKTRACVSIRMDARNFEKGLGYEIKSRHGEYESYEREYYDMIRAAFLKYSLQVRVGRMDGIFVAFHNVQRIFGFQYISLPEMDEALHGTGNTTLGDTEFHLSIKLWNKILDRATARYPKRSLRFHFETRETKSQVPFMQVFYEPVTEEEINAIQTKNQAEVNAYQERILNLPQSNPTEPSDHREAKDVEATDEIKNEATNDLSSASPAAEAPAEADVPPDVKAPTAEAAEAPAEADVPPDVKAPAKDDIPADEASAKADASTEPPQETPKRELSSFHVVVQNYVNGERVLRPENLKAKDVWVTKWQISAIEGDKVHTLYESCQKRRKQALDFGSEDAPRSAFLKRLWRFARQGRAWRKKQDDIDKRRGVTIYDKAEKSDKPE